MNTTEIKQKMTHFQSMLSMLQREEKTIVTELKTLGVNSIEEAKTLLDKLSGVDITKLEEEVVQLEKELNTWLS